MCLHAGLCFLYCPVLESGGVWQPDPAAPHARAGPEGSSIRDAAEGLPEEAAEG